MPVLVISVRHGRCGTSPPGIWDGAAGCGVCVDVLGVLTLSRIIGKPAFLAVMRVRSRTTGECSVWRMYGGTKVWKTVLRDCVQSHASFVVCTQTLR